MLSKTANLPIKKKNAGRRLARVISFGYEELFNSPQATFMLCPLDLVCLMSWTVNTSLIYSLRYAFNPESSCHTSIKCKGTSPFPNLSVKMLDPKNRKFIQNSVIQVSDMQRNFLTSLVEKDPLSICFI